VKLLKRSPSKRRPTRVFFAVDIHGSDPTFRKFVNAARVYEADVLVFGGDLMGKAVVPIVRQNGGAHRAFFLDEVHDLDGPEAMAAFTAGVERAGFYWIVVDPEEYDSYNADSAAVDRLFIRLARDRLAAWMRFAEERLAATGVRCFLTGGNDDMPEVLSVLEEEAGAAVQPCEDRVVELDEQHTMITVGYSTPTPWDTPREATEEQVAHLIEASMARVPDPARCVFNIHVPPLDSGLDRCVKLDASTDPPTPIRMAGRPVYVGGGSRAVREAIQTYQPAVGFHGHIHESPGQITYGRTRCFNPGSEYGQGVLNGVVVSIRDGQLVGYQHTCG
jgi:Icc-related predicted phosphoesterase